MADHTFVGFGFGPIQSGLFATEAFQSGRFKRIVVSEIDHTLVEAVRANNGTYYVNIAASDGIETLKIENVELLNPTQLDDVTNLHAALSEATEIVTSLPSVDFYTTGRGNSVASLLAQGLSTTNAEGTIIYAAENNNHAAEILQDVVTKALDGSLPQRVQFLNTVIGKMSRVVDDPTEIAELGLVPIAPGIHRAFLVEEFNRILVTKTTLADFRPGIDVFIEKDDLLPFEEAKLYGHNAIHALLGFLGIFGGYTKMTELQANERLMNLAREAFINDSGRALIDKYANLGDELFTEPGYRHFAEDLLERMTNPFLGDTTARAGRDVIRKLGAHDRIFGTMNLAIEHGIEPVNMAVGAMAGIAILLGNATRYDVPQEFSGKRWRDLSAEDLSYLLGWIWKGQMPPQADDLIRLTYQAKGSLSS